MLCCSVCTCEVTICNRVDLTSAKKELCRLKWNWLFVILLSSLTTISTSSPLGTLHQFITNPGDEYAHITSLSKYEPGLGESESLYAWSISMNNIGGFVGAILAAVFSNVLPYWYGFLISLLCHISGFILYGLARYGWMIITARLLAGIFTGLERALAFSYFGVSYQHYLTTLEDAGMNESKSPCRIKDVLFSLFIISTSVGLLLGAGFSAIIARIPNIDHFRAVGWYNLFFGLLLLLLLFVLFHGEYCWDSPVTCQLSLAGYGIGKVCRKYCTRIILIVFLIVCKAVIKSRTSVYEGLFNPILSDAFGFSEDITVYFFVIILVAPILGGVLLLLLEWTHISNLLIAILGIVASILGLLVMTDWQAIPADQCLNYSPFHHPELLSLYNNITLTASSQANDYCWWMDNETRITSADNSFVLNGKAQVLLDHSRMHLPDIETIDCDLDLLPGACINCHQPSSSQVQLQFSIDSDYICFSPKDTINKSESTAAKLSVQCSFDNTSCIAVCVDIDYSSIMAKTETIQTKAFKQASKSFVQFAYLQSIHILRDNQYRVAKNACESHQNDGCHWIPDSALTKEHCIDCPSICRGLGRKLNFIQFALGSLWFMFTLPIAEITLPIIISDSVSQEYQGFVMSTSVAIAELLQGITPLWLSASYGAVQKRTFLPLLIMTVIILPCLFGLLIIYCAQEYAKSNTKNNSTSLEDSQSRSSLLNPSEKQTEID